MADDILTSPSTAIFDAADNHNRFYGGSSWFSNTLDSVGNIPKYLALSVASGYNSFYRTAQSVGNFVSGSDAPVRDTGAWISSYDSDLGKYYQDNREGIDTVGFLLGSAIPGTLGIKTLGVAQKAANVGQVALSSAESTGFVGVNMGRALGLLTPKLDIARKTAEEAINASAGAVKLLNANTAKAIGAGLHQNFLEGLAWESMVQATMFKSPILDSQDFSDIAKNTLTTSLLQGAVGGVFSGVKTLWGVRKSVIAEDKIRLPFVTTAPAFDRAGRDYSIITSMHNLEQTVNPIVTPTGTSITNPAHVQLYMNKVESVLNDTRRSIRTLAGDQPIGNFFADVISPERNLDRTLKPGYSDTYFNTFAGALTVSPTHVYTEVERASDALMSAVKAGKADIDEVADRLVSSRYFQVAGEEAGQIFTAPNVLKHLGDIHTSPEQIISAASKQGFKLTKDSVFNPLDLIEKNPQEALTAMQYRYVWANHGNGVVSIPKNAIVHELDIPVLERALNDGRTDILIRRMDGTTSTLGETLDLANTIRESKKALVNEVQAKLLGDNILKGRYKGYGDHIAAGMADVRVDWLNGSFKGTEEAGMFARASYNDEFKAYLSKRLPASEVAAYPDAYLLPQAVKVVYAAKAGNDLTKAGFDEGLIHYKSMEKAYAATSSNTVAKVLEEHYAKFPEITIDKDLNSASRVGTGGGALSFEDANYGTIGAKIQRVGNAIRETMNARRKSLDEQFYGHVSTLAGNKEAGLEFIGINQQMARKTEPYVFFSQDGENFLVPSRLKKDLIKGEEDISDHIGDTAIQINNPATAKAIEAYMEHSHNEHIGFTQIQSARGKFTQIPDEPVYRPVRPDLAKYPHISFVIDNSVTGEGHRTVLTAATAEKLTALEDKVRQLGPRYNIINKANIKDYKDARGLYDKTEALNELYLDHELGTKGVFSDFLPRTDVNTFLGDFMQSLYRKSDNLVRESVKLNYEPVFDQLTKMGDQYSASSTSKLGSSVEVLKRTTKNPFYDQINTALDISKIEESGMWYRGNKLLDTSFSKAYRAIQETFAKTPSVAELDSINDALDKYGIKPAYYDAAMKALVDHKAPVGELTKFVRGSNSLLALFTLGWDFLNGVNNAIGSQILRFTELNSVFAGIKAGDAEKVGDLGKIMLPGTESSIRAPNKVIAQAYSDWFKDARDPAKPIMTRYKEQGFVKDQLEQLASMLDDLTLKGAETSVELNSKLASGFAKAKALFSENAPKVAEAGERLTGNKLFEEMNRFVSARSMEIYTDEAVKQGQMTSKEALSYIQTFVNRVEGNVLATQRPGVFQGPIGQAIGLFQSHQFNLMQNLFRYVGEGTKKDLAMLAGLQGTLYGAQSMPGFQWMNTSIVGKFSGNQQYTDLYDKTYGTLGKNLGDLFLYGLPSLVSRTNIYSRGDINPRQLTILPTSLMEVPSVGGWTNFFKNAYETLGKMANGGGWESFLQGMEHNTISRPLAGIAQTLQGIPSGTVYSTSAKGDFMYSNDLFSIATLARIAGGKPLAEGSMRDALYRSTQYESIKHTRQQSLAEDIKSTLIQGNEPSLSQVEDFAAKFVKNGGNQTEFNKWMINIYKNANQSQADKIATSLTSPFAYKMQLAMGGS